MKSRIWSFFRRFSFFRSSRRRSAVWLRRIGRVMGGLLLILALIVGVLHHPRVQTYLAHRATDWLSAELGHEVQIGQLTLWWYDGVTAKGVLIRDLAGEEMIRLERLNVRFRLDRLLGEAKTEIKAVSLSQGLVHLISRPEGMNLSQFIESIEGLLGEDPNPDQPGKPFALRSIVLSKVAFRMDEQGAAPQADSLFDAAHIHLRDINAEVNQLLVDGPEVSMRIRRMEGYEVNAQLPISKLETRLSISDTAMIFDELTLGVGNSLVRDYLGMHYRSYRSLRYFTDSVRLDVRLKQSFVTSADLAAFAPILRRYQEVVHLDAEANGSIADLQVCDMSLSFGRQSRLIGEARLTGLPNVDSLYLDVLMNTSDIYASDLKQYAPAEATAYLQRAGKLQFVGDFTGSTDQFAAKGQLRSPELGELRLDLKADLPKERIAGSLAMHQCQVGKLLDEPMLGEVTLQGDLNGHGFDQQSAHYYLDMQIPALQFMGYTYQDIVIDSSYIENQRFTGGLTIRDSSLRMALKGDINLKEKKFNFQAQLDTLCFKPIGLLSQELSAHAKLNVQFDGLNPAKMDGSISATEVNMMLEDRRMQLNELMLMVISTESGTKELRIMSDVIRGRLGGFEDITKPTQDFEFLYEEFIAKLLNNDKQFEQIVSSGKDPLINREDQYNLDFNFTIKDADRVFQFLDQPYSISADTKLTGGLEVGSEVIFSLQLDSDSLRAGDIAFDGNSLTAFISRYQHPDGHIDYESELDVFSKSQVLGGVLTDSLDVSMHKLGRTIFADAYIAHGETHDHAAVEFSLEFEPGQAIVRLTQNSRLLLLEQPWHTEGFSKITVDLDSGETQIKDVRLTSGKERVRVNGMISRKHDEPLRLEIENLDLSPAGRYLDMQMGGKAEAAVEFRGVLDSAAITGNLLVSELTMEDYLLGDLSGEVSWNHGRQIFDILSRLTRDQNELISLSGFYGTGRPNGDTLGLDLNLANAELKLIAPFVKDVLSDLGGKVVGQLTISGSPAQPDLQGQLRTINAKMKVDYLNTTYTFSDRIAFSPDSITFTNFSIKDDALNEAKLNGHIQHDYFSKFRLFLKASMKEFRVLNTDRGDNDYFYGRAFATGNLKVTGTPNNPSLFVDATTAKGTRLYIPLDGTEEVEEQGFIRFVKKDTLSKNRDKELKVDLSWINMEFNLEITPDAYCEIIFDKKAGDIIRGNAKGRINMKINTLGDFEMFGGIEIVEGFYNFTMLNVVNKEFEVVPGGRIRWSGDPYKAQINLTAQYKQRASLAPIIEADSSILNSPEIRRRYPVYALLHLKGDLLQPKISFDIEIEDYPANILVDGTPVSLESYVAAFNQLIKSDEQEMNRQVFSLIILKKLAQKSGFRGVNTTAGSNVSEFLANQLSYLLSQVDDRLEVNVDLHGLSQEALNTARLRLSYSVLDGRLRITRDGTFTNVQNEADVSSIVGDWTVEYLLKPNGSLRLKMYHKHNVNAFNAAVNNSTSTAGVSIMHTKSFDIKKNNKPEKPKKNTPGPGKLNTAKTEEEEEEQEAVNGKEKKKKK